MPATLDRTPRYAPDRMLFLSAEGWGVLAVIRHNAYSPRTHPKGCPIHPDLTAVEFVTAGGSRWMGFASAWINSELRLVVSGVDPRDEVRMGWPVCTTP